MSGLPYWAVGNLTGNFNRGLFAEWLVGKALGVIEDGATRAAGHIRPVGGNTPSPKAGRQITEKAPSQIQAGSGPPRTGEHPTIMSGSRLTEPPTQHPHVPKVKWFGLLPNGTSQTGATNVVQSKGTLAGARVPLWVFGRFCRRD